MVVSLITAATALLLQLIMLANNNETNEALLLFLKGKNGKYRFIALEPQNRNHDEEMEFLKIENLEMRSKINQMNNKQLNSDNGPKSSENIFETFIGSTNKPKRPAQLLPITSNLVRMTHLAFNIL